MAAILASVTTVEAAAYALSLFLLYSCGLAIYRVFLSPLARQKIPGPKLAAASLWYEFYYDVILRGRYTWRIGELHDKHGPIIRINPYEVHIKDPDFYDALYTGSTNPRDKWWWQAPMFANPTSHFASIEHDLHRRRRAPVNPFFSKRSVANLEPMIAAKVDQLCQRLHTFSENGKPVTVRFATAALIFDIMTEYAFGTSYHTLDDFNPAFLSGLESLMQTSHLNNQFPWLLPILQSIPHWLVQIINPQMARVVGFRNDITTQVEKVMKQRKSGDKGHSLEEPTIFGALLEPGALPPEEQTLNHLVDEAQAIVGAGLVTTVNFFNTTVYHVLANPAVYVLLRDELHSEIQPFRTLPLRTLERLPYLSAVITEGLRMSYGTTHRLTRVSPRAPIIYKDYVLPPGTAVGMTTLFMHDDPDVFPEPHAFRPERWLNLDPDVRRKMERSFVPFSRGTRGCIGQHFAMAEIYLTMAALFGRCGLKLFETTREDVDTAHDFITPILKSGSEGVQFKVSWAI